MLNFIFNSRYSENLQEYIIRMGETTNTARENLGRVTAMVTKRNKPCHCRVAAGTGMTDMVGRVHCRADVQGIEWHQTFSSPRVAAKVCQIYERRSLG